MANRKEKERMTWIILLLYGFFNTFDQWTRVLLPFMQWQLQPRPSLFDLLLLNSIGNCAVLTGSFFVAQLIDSNGCCTAAIAVTIATAIYQILIAQISNYYLFGIAQLLLVGNHLPMVIDAMIGELVGVDGDDKERTSLIMRLTIPESIAYAVGPYLAIQVLYMITPSLYASQVICGCLHLAIALPLIYMMVPDKQHGGHRSYLPSVEAYREMFYDSKLQWALLFLVIVAAPYSAYDQVIRMNLSSHIIFMPADMAKLAFLLGLTTLACNIFVLPALQARMGPQALLQLSMGVLAVSYLYLSQVKDYVYLLIGMPLQVLGICIAYGQLSSQIMGNVGRANLGKAAALNRGTQLAASAMAPLITGYYVDGEEASILCYVSAFLSVIGVLVVHKYANFMRSHLHNLPLRAHDE
ncbi:hypothetical protein Tcan_04223 [Toxocara canis]|uniref:Uncharacterized protein n=1 Tax=Toxocara canis TaxID=6265 RepID=A0A0B2UQ02_TOXCA|nr:hypothetical protein Tcan_04223 [Toxocara canis]